MSAAFDNKIVASVTTEIAEKTILATKLFSVLLDFTSQGSQGGSHLATSLATYVPQTAKKNKKFHNR